MAWEYVGVGSAVSIGSGNLTLTEPAGVQEGDLLVACISYRSNVAFSPPASSIWATATSQNTGNTTNLGSSGTIASGYMAWGIRGSSAPNLTFTRSGGSSAIGRIVAYRGVAASGSLVVAASATMGSSGSTLSVSSQATENSEDLIVFAACGTRNAGWSAFTAATDPSTASGSGNQTGAPTIGTWLERAESTMALTPNGSIAIADAVRSTAGATGNLTATASQTGQHVGLVAIFKQDTGGAANTNISIALAGEAATIAATIEPGTGITPTLSGAAATISATATTRTNSTIALSGNAATIAATAEVNTNSAIALAGAAATISGTVAIGTITTASISLQGAAATISATIEPSTQAIVNVTGNAATIAATVQTTVQGAIALTSSPATIAISARSETLGAIALSGGAATISAQVSVSNPVDPSLAISLQGEAATIAIGVRTTSRMAIGLAGSAAIFQVRIGSGSSIVISQVSSKVLQKTSSSRVVKLSSSSLVKNSRVI